MNLLEIILTAISLAMDAFAVSVCKGLSLKKVNLKNSFTIGIYFGTFQTFMPLIGYFLGYNLKDFIISIDHWICFILLGLIGLNMIFEGLENKIETSDKLDFKTMILLALATSIDALAIGVTFAFFKINITLVVILIGIITFLLSAIGVLLGNIFGSRLESKAQLFGGITLVLIGLKILLEHLNII